jgi:transcriptional regulator with XRE-family HTH domain
MNPDDDFLNRLFVQNLATSMKYQGISMSELGRRTKLAKTHIAGILHGKHFPNLRTVNRLCKAIGADPSAMFDV